MASTSAGAESVKTETIDTSMLLAGQRVYLVPDHFDDLSANIIKSKAAALGATSTIEQRNATLVIVNENSPLWDEHAKESILSTAVKKPLFRPHHWLAVCLDKEAVVNVEDLPVEVPFMVQQLTSRHPLKIWVSKNVERHVMETPEEAHRNVIRDLESVGAVIVTKRAHADVLIVDMTSNFFNVVKKEKEDNERHWQKLAQRDWVVFCMANKRLQLTTKREDEAAEIIEDGAHSGSVVQTEAEIQTEAGPGPAAGPEVEVEANQNGSDVDSMMAEDDVPSKPGPGRPTGKPRIEYTPEDDDFLCRYLACYYPHGAWGSRKTFQQMVLDQASYPPAERHSSQSWHERFKKNSGPFGRRVTRFIDEKIDETLKTAPERAKAAEKRAERVTQPEQSAPPAESNEAEMPATSSGLAETTTPAVLVPERLIQPSGIPTSPPSGQSARSGPQNDIVHAEVNDRKGKGREVNPPSLTVTETAVQETQVEAEMTIAATTQESTTAIASSSLAAAVAPGDASDAPPPKKRKKKTAISDIPTQPASALLGRRHETPVNTRDNDDDRSASGLTPLRRQIERSAEKRRRDLDRTVHDSDSFSRRGSKRPSSPDKVYAHVNLPPPRSVAQSNSPAPEPEHRISSIPPRELTPAERQQSIIDGERIVQNVAALYRAKIATLGQKYGVGVKEISAATSEVKRRNGGRSAVDWAVLEKVLQEQYGT